MRDQLAHRLELLAALVLVEAEQVADVVRLAVPVRTLQDLGHFKFPRHTRIAPQPNAIASKGNTTAPAYAPPPPGRSFCRNPVTTSRRTNQNRKNTLTRPMTPERTARIGAL
jgi:hypothetical protein